MQAHPARERANEKRENSFRSFPDIFVPTVFDGRGLRPRRSHAKGTVIIAYLSRFVLLDKLRRKRNQLDSNL